jgi:hypothetical protein
MSTGAISSCTSCTNGFRAMAAGLRQGSDARLLAEVLDSAGLLDSDLAAALDSVQVDSQSLTSAAVAVIHNGLLGGILDIVA